MSIDQCGNLFLQFLQYISNVKASRHDDEYYSFLSSLKYDGRGKNSKKAMRIAYGRCYNKTRCRKFCKNKDWAPNPESGTPKSF